MSKQTEVDPGFERMKRFPLLGTAVRAGNLLLISGQVPEAPDGTYPGDDLVGQTRQVFSNVGKILEAARATFDDVVRVTGYFTFDIHDPSLVEQYWTTRSEFIKHKAYATTGVQVAALRDPRFLLEVDVMAVIR